MWPAALRASARRVAAPGGRRLWVAAASDDRLLSAAVSKCVSTIRAAVGGRTRTHPAPYAQPGAGQRPLDACFVLVSQTYAAVHIECLTSEIAQRLREAGLAANIVGTVVDKVLDGSGRPDTRGLSVLYHHADGGLRAVPFYVGDQHGRQRLREAAVGRWHNDVTDRFEVHKAQTRWVAGESSVTRAASHVELPPELTASIGDPETVRLVLLASDRESRQVLDALDARFPGATTLGIVGSQTPFLNGREYTLLTGGQAHSSGVLGFAFVAPGGTHAQERGIARPPRVACSGLEPISRALRIERCKGNVVLELEDGAAVNSLISTLRARRLAVSGGGDESDSMLYARVMRTPDAGRSSSDATDPPLEPASVVLQVTGGSPAKGGLALGTLRDLAPGQYIQFLMAAPEAHHELPWGSNEATTTDELEIRFGVCRGDSSSAPNSAEPGSDAQMQRQPVARVFGGATEGGFVYGHQQTRQPPVLGYDSGSVFTGSIECTVPRCAVALGLKRQH